MIHTVLDIVLWAVVAFVLFGAVEMRLRVGKYRTQWRRAICVMAEIQEENERALAERDEMMGLNRTLVGVLDEAEARWAIFKPERDPDEQAAHERTDRVLTRASQFLNAAHQRAREEDRQRKEERMTRAALRARARRDPMENIHAILDEVYGRPEDASRG